MLNRLGQVKPVLIFGYGNPSRGDDALGPALIEKLQNALDQSDIGKQVEYQTDFQLQIEHTLDMEDRRLIVFIDASLSPEKAFEFNSLTGKKDPSYTSHAMSPDALLNLYNQLHPENNTEVYLLAIRGYEFELGSGMTAQACGNLSLGQDFLHEWLKEQVIHLSS